MHLVNYRASLKKKNHPFLIYIELEDLFQAIIGTKLLTIYSNCSNVCHRLPLHYSPIYYLFCEWHILPVPIFSYIMTKILRFFLTLRFLK